MSTKRCTYTTIWTISQLQGAVVSLSLSPDEVDVLAGTDAGKMYRVLIADMTFVEIAAAHVTPIAAVDFGRQPEANAIADGNSQ